MPTAKILVVGSMNADFMTTVKELPEPGQTVIGTDLVTEPGGKSSNQAAAAALLEADVTLIGVVGTDAIGDRLIIEASARGVDTSRVRRNPDTSTGCALISVNREGENTIIVSPGANATLRPEDVSDADLHGNPLVLMALEIPLETVVAVAERAAAAGAQVLLNASPAQPLPRRLLANVDVLVVNEGELLELLGDQIPSGQWEDYARRLHEDGIERTVVTLGKQGAVVIEHSDGHLTITAVDPASVTAVDTTGSGDAFMGGLAAELAAGRTLTEAAQTGALAGAWAAQGHGAQPSYGRRTDLDSLASTVAARM
ncbi:ribokinase [Arthrobacter sp. B6]|uniref:ribokinase n=1 Tax=Arthrobacter sp. B6 TaxID=1570137 RepID=UPI00082CFB32|nr:ribokinase [Arthrobacter sp. B6]